MNFLKRNADILLIVLLGTVLRLTISLTHSYSNDELSAINRLRFDNFSELIETGVKTGDMHPAGVQVFMKLWSVGGTTEGWMRFPFVLCGIFSIVVLFILGKRWFNRSTGLIAASLLSVLYFPVMNAEFARPYSPGLLICLLIGWWMHKVLFAEVSKYRDAFILGLLFAAAMYTHYFAFLMAGFMGVTGLLFLNKGNIKYYLIAGGTALVLFIPHIPITQYHLSVGGLGWLGAPEKDWLFQFVFHAFNESKIALTLVGLLLLLTLIFRRRIQTYDRKYLLLCVLWFFGTYLVGHILSLVGTPVLKFPVMLFALPYLLLLIGFALSHSKLNDVFPNVPAKIPFLLLFVGLTSTIVEKDLYGNQHFGLFEEVADHTTEWIEKYGEDDTYVVFNISDPNYMNYYAKQWDKEIDFDWDVIEYSDDYAIRQDLKGRKEQYLILGYSARLTLVNVFETAKEIYPTIVDYHKYNNCAVFLLARTPQKGKVQEVELVSDFSQRKIDERWRYDEQLTENDFYVLDSLHPYGPDFVFKKGELDFKGKYLRISCYGAGLEDFQLTVTLSVSRNEQAVLLPNGDPFWYGHDLDQVLGDNPLAGGSYAQFSLDVFDELEAEDEVKISFWNRNGVKVYIGDVRIELLENIWN